MCHPEPRGTIVRKQVGPELAVERQLIFAQEADDRLHSKGLDFDDPGVNLGSWNRVALKVSWASPARQVVNDDPLHILQGLHAFTSRLNNAG